MPFEHRRQDLLARHHQRRLRLDVGGLDIIVDVDRAAALHLLDGQDAVLLERFHILFGVERLVGVDRIVRAVEPASLRLFEPFAAVIVAVEDDARMLLVQLLDDGQDLLVELRLGDIFKSVRNARQHLCGHDVHHHRRRGQRRRRADHAELELVAGERERRRAVAVGGVALGTGDVIDAHIDVLLGRAGDRVSLDDVVQ